MAVALVVFRSPIAAEFRNRVAQLGRLEEWWASPERMPLAVYGRRRVGKSWLLRRFADGKPAVVLVAERLTAGAQLDRFAATLEPLLGVRPQLDDVPSLFRAFYRAGQRERLLVVLDEFPWLLPASEDEAMRTLSALAAVLEEERDRSQLKLVLCGSLVAQMEALFAERHPLHGRLVRFELRPFDFTDARQLLAGHDPIEQFQRFAIAGGMPRYLAALSAGNLRQAVCRQVLDRDGPLWDEARAILGQELRQPAVYFAILEQLAGGDKELGKLTNATRLPGATVSRYLATLAELRIVSRRLPLGAPATARVGHWRLDDAFLRFWFRFVFPYQAEAGGGLPGGGPLRHRGGPGARPGRRTDLRGVVPCRSPAAGRRHPGRGLVGTGAARVSPGWHPDQRRDRHRRHSPGARHRGGGGEVDGTADGRRCAARPRRAQGAGACPGGVHAGCSTPRPLVQPLRLHRRARRRSGDPGPRQPRRRAGVARCGAIAPIGLAGAWPW